MERLLIQGLLAEEAIAKPFTFDIRGRGAFWGIEFDFSGHEAKFGSGKQTFAILVQARCLKNGLIVMGFNGGASLDGSKGDHLILGPAYNATTKEIERIVDIFVESVEEILRELLV